MFNLFGRGDSGPDALFIDKVYIGSRAKMNACLQMAKSDKTILFIAWFSETAYKFKTLFIQNDIDVACITETKFVHRSQLQNYVPVFVEHYPLHAKELELIEKWNMNKILVYSAMDEPLFRHFGSEKMIPLIKLLGMKENESIEHPFVTQSIIKGQQKIANKVSIEQTANSQAEWMERNLKG